MPEATGRGPGALVGRRLGPYAVGEVLGRGGTATVHRAVDTRRDRAVALKVVLPDAMGSIGWGAAGAAAAGPDATGAVVTGPAVTGPGAAGAGVAGPAAAQRDRLEDEARALAAVVHPHVVGLLGRGEADGCLYLALGLVDGPDLAVLLGGRPMPADRALALLDQVADALDAVHAHGLVHLDVKPANVLVASADGHVHLADFGLARPAGTARTTADGGVVGSPAYAAPELLRGEAVDTRADVYSLTCVLFTCLTGHPPYTGGVEEVVAAHQRGVLPPTGWGPAVDDVLRIGAAPDPAHRWARGHDLLRAARAALDLAALDLAALDLAALDVAAPRTGVAGIGAAGTGAAGIAGAAGLGVRGPGVGGPGVGGAGVGGSGLGGPPERLRPPEPPSAGDPFGRSAPPVRPLVAAAVVLVVALLVLGVVLTVG